MAPAGDSSVYGNKTNATLCSHPEFVPAVRLDNELSRPNNPSRRDFSRSKEH